MAYPTIQQKESIITVGFEFIPLNSEGFDYSETGNNVFDDEYMKNVMSGLGLDFEKVGEINGNSIFEITAKYFEIEYFFYKHYDQGITFEEYLDTVD